MKIYYLSGDLINCKQDWTEVYYFDNNSTTLIYDKEVKKGIISWISCGNPSNILHDYGKRAHEKLKVCHHTIARDLHVYPKEIYFTSGATESNNMVIQGVINNYTEKAPGEKYTIITSLFEHPSVYNVFKHYETLPNIEVLWINICSDPTDPECRCIRASDVKKAVNMAKNKVILLSIMYANNETGAIQDIKKIGRIARANKIFFHTDATQAIGKYIIHPKKLGIDAMSFSGHKFHGPKGVGALYLDERQNKVINLCYGGEQEGKKRPGTENVANIIGMTLALQRVHENRTQKNKEMKEKKDYIIAELKKEIKIQILGPPNKCLPNTILMMIEELGTCNKLLVEELNKKKIYVSMGSACQTQSKKSSHVLDTMGLDDKEKLKVIRISLSDYTTLYECEYLIKNLIKIVQSYHKD